MPIAQNTRNRITLAVRTAGDSLRLMPSLEAVVRRIDPAQAVSRVRTMEAIASESTARPRFRAQLVGSFATFAVVLAAFGVFSVLTFMVEQRSREFSLRLALGASAGDLLRLVVGSGCRILAMGLVLGPAASALLVRFLAGLLFGVTPFDVATFVAAPATLTLIALMACVAPALRALRADPAVALREQ